MKRFLRKMAGFLPVIVMIAVINLIADPANIYEAEYETKAAGLLLAGKNIAGMTNYDERLLQEKIIRGENTCPETIILGSSRVMMFSEESLDISDYRNHGMSGAGVFDYLGILGVYEDCDKMPGRVILGLDPWVLNESDTDLRHQTLMAYIDRFETKIGAEGKRSQINLGFIQRKLQFLSIPYFQSSVKKLLLNPEEVLEFKRDMDFYVLPDGFDIMEVEEAIRYTDGSTDSDKEEREKSIDDVNVDAKEYVTGAVYKIEGYNRLHLPYCKYLEILVDYLQNRGIEVVFYLPPYHPYVYQRLVENPDYKNVFEAEEFFIDLAGKKGIDIYGAYNPALLGCTETDFSDGMHMVRRSMWKAWKKIRAGGQDQGVCNLP